MFVQIFWRDYAQQQKWNFSWTVTSAAGRRQREQITWNQTRTAICLHGFLGVSQDGLAALEKARKLSSIIPKLSLKELRDASPVVKVSSAPMASLAWFVSITILHLLNYLPFTFAEWFLVHFGLWHKNTLRVSSLETRLYMICSKKFICPGKFK